MLNPFSTKFWSPGALPFQFAESGDTIDNLLEKSYRLPICQIVGSHGTGKTTLLLELLKRYQERGKNVQFLLFNDQHRNIPRNLSFLKNQFFFVDGVEQLSFWDRFRLLSRMRRVILTVHYPIWFVPILYRTKPQFSVFVQLVRQMLPDSHEEPELRAVYNRSAGNFRTAFFELYDQWEKRQSRR